MNRLYKRIAALICMALMVLACDGGRPNDQPRESVETNQTAAPLEDYHRARLQVESVAIEEPPDNPLKTALGLIGLDAGKLAVQQELAENYRLLARNPLIDRFANTPLQLSPWAESFSDRLQAKGSSELTQMVAQIMTSLNGGVSYEQTIMEHDASGGLLDAYQYLYHQYGRTPRETDLAAIRSAGFSAELDNLLARLLFALADASMLGHKALGALSPAEIETVSAQPERYFFSSEGLFRFLSAPTHTQLKLLDIARKIDFKALMTAALVLSKAVDHVTAMVPENDGVLPPFPFFEKGGPKTGMVLQLETPAGPIVVLGQDNNTFNRPAALVVDLGGDDRYETSVATGHLLPGRCALHIDLSGNDIYGQKNRSYSQGVGILGVGLLVDLNGRDQYRAAHMAQGCGMYGFGGVVDLGGDDFYRMGLMGQGFGVFGIGLLVDRDGNDRYLISGLGQGAGSTMGYGVLCDIQGNDKYLADRKRRIPGLRPDVWCHAQGVGLSIRSPDWAQQASFYGGIGLLSDGGGKDFYHATGGNVMGSSYFKSIGALVDHGGDDTYVPENGYGVGFAVHLSHAILVDKSGNDLYIAASHTGGVASDRSIAVFLDYQGDDEYGPSPEYIQQANILQNKRKTKTPAASRAARPARKLAALSYGAAQKRKALGLMIDFSGNDRYDAQEQGQGESCGGVMPPQFPQHWSHAVLLDLGGTDFYNLPGRRDNAYFKYQHHGICYDTEVAHPFMPKPGDASEHRQPWSQVAAGTLKRFERYGTVLRALCDADLFVRFAALGKVCQGGPSALDMLFKVLPASSDSDLNRDLLEALNFFYVTHKITPSDAERIAGLLKTPDPYVRQFAAQLLGSLGAPEAVPWLADALRTETSEARIGMIRALGHIGTSRALNSLIKAAKQASDVPEKRAAVEALGNMIANSSATAADGAKTLQMTLLDLLEDDDAIVRYHAANALFFVYRGDPAVTNRLMQHLNDEDIYVQRAVAKTVIETGHPAGIPVLIDTLRFRSIDTYEFYDQDLIKTLAYYCGVDFTDELRFDYRTWQRWWQSNGPSVNLDHNLRVKQQIETAFDTYPEQSGLKTFKRLMASEKDNPMVKRRYERFCRDRIRYLLGHRVIKRSIIDRCIVLQRILTELNPDDLKAQKQLQLFEQQRSEFN